MEEKAFPDLIKESYEGLPPMVGSLVEGEITGVEDQHAIVCVGLKAEGRIPLSQFYDEDIQVGDKVVVYVKKMENADHECVLSRIRARREESWNDLQSMHEKGQPVTARVLYRIRGGFVMDALGATVFLPQNQTHLNSEDVIGSEHQCFIIKMDREKGSIVVSQRSDGTLSHQYSRDSSHDHSPSEPMDVSVGDIVEGTVKNITDYGAFIKVGNASALLYVKDISWLPVKHPSDVLKVGQSVKVQVIKVEQGGRRVALSMKALEKSPWEEAAKILKEGQMIKGEVTNVTNYGFFVKMPKLPIEGLVHVSEMSWTENIEDPSSMVKSGDEVSAVIIQIDPEKERINLSLKEAQENPWKDLIKGYQEGMEVDTVVSRVAKFGIFVKLKEGMEILIRLNDLGGNHYANWAAGDELKARVSNIDKEKYKMSLELLDAGGDVQEKKTRKTRKGQVHTCTVVSVTEDGLKVSLEDGSEGFIRRSHLAQDRSEQRPNLFVVGNKVDAMVIDSHSNTGGQANLSIKELEAEQQRKAVKEYGSLGSGSRLTNVLGGAIEIAKETTKPKAGAKSKKDTEVSSEASEAKQDTGDETSPEKD